MARFYAAPPLQTVKCTQRNEVGDKYDPTWSCVRLCMGLQHKLNRRKLSLLCCVCVCLCKGERAGFLLSCDAQNAPAGIDNPKKSGRRWVVYPAVYEENVCF